MSEYDTRFFLADNYFNLLITRLISCTGNQGQKKVITNYDAG